jgi:hypothetical protein
VTALEHPQLHHRRYDWQPSELLLHILAISFRTLSLLLGKASLLCFVYTNSYTLRRRHYAVGDGVPGCVYRAYDLNMIMRLKVFPIHFRNTRAGR